HDDQNGSLRGENTVRVFTAEGLSVAHLGNLGHLLTERQAAAIGRSDALLLPVGGTYTTYSSKAKAVVDQLSPRVIIPMHYRKGDKGCMELVTLDAFLGLFPAEQVRCFLLSRLELTADTPALVAVLAMP